jgi:hypothetical protein
MKLKLNFLWIGVIVVALASFLALKNLSPEQDIHGDFAKCLSDNGAIMFGTKTCGHCKNQKELFGGSFRYINYVECTEQMETCEQNGISGVPTWLINGEKYPGEQSLERLSQISGCDL